MFDIIGDIHGYAGPLKALLQKLGYTHNGVSWSHPDRKVVFLGDFIDRGPEQVEVVEIAKSMVEAGRALAVMGNHELNAIAWVTPVSGEPGKFLREHSDQLYWQHADFLDQVGENSALHLQYIEWFKTLPVYLDFDEFRAVHACWDPIAIEILQPHLQDNGALKPQSLIQALERGNPVYDAVKPLLKGVEIKLPSGFKFTDKDDVPRRKTRIKWWHKAAQNLQELAFVSDEVRPQVPAVPLDHNPAFGYDNQKPVFVGHYWLSGTPQPLTATIACLDYSIAGDLEHGKLVAYRFNGDESTLEEKQFCWVRHN